MIITVIIIIIIIIIKIKLLKFDGYVEYKSKTNVSRRELIIKN